MTIQELLVKAYSHWYGRHIQSLPFATLEDCLKSFNMVMIDYIEKHKNLLNKEKDCV